MYFVHNFVQVELYSYNVYYVLSFDNAISCNLIAVLLLNFVIRDVGSLFYNLYSQHFARRNKESIAPNK